MKAIVNLRIRQHPPENFIESVQCPSCEQWTSGYYMCYHTEGDEGYLSSQRMKCPQCGKEYRAEDICIQTHDWSDKKWVEEVSPWINCKDLMPENAEIDKYSGDGIEGYTVLVSGYLYPESKEPSVGMVNRYKITELCFPYINDSSVKLWQWSGHFHRITHWMPLPEPAENE